MAAEPRITVEGCGPGSPDYLTLAAGKAVESADVLVGAPRLLELFPQYSGERMAVTAKLYEVLDGMAGKLDSPSIAMPVTGADAMVRFSGFETHSTISSARIAGFSSWRT
jgi:precorrin-6B methylase 1